MNDVDEFKLQTVDEILIEMEIDGYEGFLIEGIIDAAASTIQGDSYLGKTFMAIDIARSLTTGEPFLGRKVIRQAGRIAFLFTDPGAKYALAERVRDAGLDRKRIAGNSFYAPHRWEDWKAVRDQLKSAGVDVVVIDNTTDLADDANGPREVKLVTDGMRLWVDSGISLINIHHMNKGGPWGKSGFGSIMWRKWSRAELTLTGNPKSSQRKLSVIPNDGAASEFTLTFDPSGSPVFTVRSEDGQVVKRDRQRSDETLAENRKIAEWIVANGQGITNVSAVARRLGDTFTGRTVGTHREYLNKGKYPVDHDGNGAWSLRDRVQQAG